MYEPLKIDRTVLGEKISKMQPMHFEAGFLPPQLSQFSVFPDNLKIMCLESPSHL
jgi:hypothetical protein